MCNVIKLQNQPKYRDIGIEYLFVKSHNIHGKILYSFFQQKQENFIVDQNSRVSLVYPHSLVHSQFHSLLCISSFVNHIKISNGRRGIPNPSPPFREDACQRFDFEMAIVVGDGERWTLVWTEGVEFGWEVFETGTKLQKKKIFTFHTKLSRNILTIE